MDRISSHSIKQMPSLLPEVPVIPVEQYKKGGKVKTKKGSVTQTVNVYVTKRGGGGKRNPPKPPTLTANGMPVSYQQSLPLQFAEMSKIRQDMRLGFQQQQMQLQQLRSHINQPLPATLPEDRRLYPTMAIPPPASVDITTNINPAHDRDIEQIRATINPELFPFAASALSSGLNQVSNSPFAFSAHQTPVQSRRGSLSTFIRGEMNRPDALTLGEALHGNRTAVAVADARPFLPHIEPRPLPFRDPVFMQDVATGSNPVGRPSNESLWTQRIIIPKPYQQVADQKEPDQIILGEDDLLPRKMKKGGKILKK